jgi:hypothetical protein
MGAALLGFVTAPAMAGNGNGSPTGAHYNLNVIGVNDKTAEMKGDNRGHSIFVKLWGKSKIWLCEAGVDEECDHLSTDAFAVLDKNGTDTDGALFALPNPDPDGDGTTVYSVFARALGSPKDNPYADVTTCATDPDGDLVCSIITLTLTRDKGQSKFDNVSKYLLYIYTPDGQRVPLFWDDFEDFYWDWDNYGLRLAQLRFYECTSTVPAWPGDGPTTTTCFD